MTKKIATHVIHGERFGNSYLQIGQTAVWVSICIAQEGHSFFFMCFTIDFLATWVLAWIMISLSLMPCVMPF